MALVVVGHGAEPPPSSTAGPAGCDRWPGSGFSHRATTRWHGQADRHRDRPRRAVWRRSSGHSRA
jgi:hypothetical protein